jgi:hypothetical protein
MYMLLQAQALLLAHAPAGFRLCFKSPMALLILKSPPASQPCCNCKQAPPVLLQASLVATSSRSLGCVAWMPLTCCDCTCRGASSASGRLQLPGRLQSTRRCPRTSTPTSCCCCSGRRSSWRPSHSSSECLQWPCMPRHSPARPPCDPRRTQRSQQLQLESSRGWPGTAAVTTLYYYKGTVTLAAAAVAGQLYRAEHTCT